MRSSGFDPVSAEIFDKRLRTVTLFALAVFAVLFMRLWFTQVVNGPSYRIQSESNRIHLQDILPLRGRVFDRNGELLVDNRPSYDLFLIPEEVQSREQLGRSLQALIGLEPPEFEAKLQGVSRRYGFRPISLKRNVTRDQLAAIETNRFNLPGLMIQVRPERYYVRESFGSHVIGYVGEISEDQLRSGRYAENKPGDLIGKYGVEGRWQESLNGIRGGEQVEVDAAGRKLRVISRKAPVPGMDIRLTIDRGLQRVAEDSLKGKVGAIAALNPKNGEVLALASSPDFDPNAFVRGIDEAEWKRIVSSKASPLQNRAISGQYPPGSVFKIVVALAGLEEGILDPEEEIFCNGSYRVGNRTYRCWRRGGHGKVDLHRALVESCDVYFYTLGKRLGVDKIASYARMLGLGEKPNFDVGGDQAGLIPTSRWKLQRWGVPWQKGETVSTAIGQSFVLVTPLQAAGMIGAVFNGGRVYQPKVVKWVGKDEKTVYRFTPTVLRKTGIKEGHLARIRRALVGVVNEPRGTGSKARMDGLIVAGKTGTAQVVNLKKEKSWQDKDEMPDEFKDHAWFVATAPAEDPRLAVAVLIEHGGHGGSAAAPIALEILSAYLKGPQESGGEGSKDVRQKVASEL